MLSVEYSLFTYLYIKTVEIIHTKSVFSTEITDSSKDLQRTLAAIWWKKNGGLNTTITTKYHPTELQGEKCNFETKQCDCHQFNQWWNLEKFIQNGSSRQYGFLMICSVMYKNNIACWSILARALNYPTGIQLSQRFSFQFNQIQDVKNILNNILKKSSKQSKCLQCNWPWSLKNKNKNQCHELEKGGKSSITFSENLLNILINYNSSAVDPFDCFK